MHDVYRLLAFLGIRDEADRRKPGDGRRLVRDIREPSEPKLRIVGAIQCAVLAITMAGNGITRAPRTGAVTCH